MGSTAHAELTTQLARSLGLQGSLDEATTVLETVALQQPAAAVVQARLALERGRLINSAGRTDDAIEHFRAALRTAESAHEDFLAVDAAHMLAITDQEHSEVWTARGLRIAADSDDPRTQRWAGSLHNNAGWARHDAGDFTGALEEFEAALTAYSTHGSVEQVRVARWAVARALRSLAQFGAAMDIQLRLAEHGPADGYVEEELAELALATGQVEVAREHAGSAAALLGADRWFAQYESGRLDRLRQIAAGD